MTSLITCQCYKTIPLVCICVPPSLFSRIKASVQRGVQLKQSTKPSKETNPTMNKYWCSHRGQLCWKGALHVEETLGSFMQRGRFQLKCLDWRWAEISARIPRRRWEAHVRLSVCSWHQNKSLLEVNARVGQQKGLCSVSLWSDPAEMGEKEACGLSVEPFSLLLVFSSFWFSSPSLFLITRAVLFLKSCWIFQWDVWDELQETQTRLRTAVKSSRGEYWVGL